MAVRKAWCYCIRPRVVSNFLGDRATRSFLSIPDRDKQYPFLQNLQTDTGICLASYSVGSEVSYVGEEVQLMTRLLLVLRWKISGTVPIKCGLGWCSGYGTALLVGRSRDRSSVASLQIFSVATDGTMCPGVDSASKNEYQENSWGRRRTVRKGDDLTTFIVPKVEKTQEP